MKIPHLRWCIAFALFAASVLNYVDRSVLGLLAPTIQADLHLSDAAYASVLNFFLLAYTVAYLFSGRIVDRLGVRLSLALFVAWWSVANALTGLARSAASLSCFRFLLGLGEAGMFTAAPKAVAEWFPVSERGIAIGLYSVGSAVGATIAPLLVARIAVHFGWRWVFAVSPVAAGLWLILWLILYRPPLGHPLLTEKERGHLAANLAPAPETEALPAPPWSQVFREPLVWRLMLARMLTDPVWYFFQFWMPKYLHDVRGLDQRGLGILWIVFLAADAGFLLGGIFAGRAIKRGLAAPKARIRIMALSSCLVPASLLIPSAPSVALVLILAMVVVYAHTSWLSNLTSLIVDLVPKPILATAFGIIACGSVLGGMAMNQAVAWLVTHRSYAACFYAMAFAHPLALILVWKLRK